MIIIYAMTLFHLAPGDSARVTGFRGGHGIRRNLNQLGIHIGDVVHLAGRGAFRGPVLIDVHGVRVALGRGVAHHVLVERMPVPGESSSDA